MFFFFILLILITMCFWNDYMGHTHWLLACDWPAVLDCDHHRHHTWLQSTKMAKTLIRRLHTTVYIDDIWVATLLFYTVYDCGGKIVFLTLFWVVVTNLLKQFFLDWTGVSTTYSYGPLICKTPSVKLYCRMQSVTGVATATGGSEA